MRAATPAGTALDQLDQCVDVHPRSSASEAAKRMGSGLVELAAPPGRDRGAVCSIG